MRAYAIIPFNIMVKKDFDPVEEKPSVLTLFPVDLFDDLAKEAEAKKITIPEILRRSVSLLRLHTNFLAEDSVESPTTTDPDARGIHEIIKQEKALVDIEFQAFKCGESADKRTRSVRITMSHSMKLDFDATAMGLSLQSASDFLLYAGFFHRHLKQFFDNPPPEELPQ